MQTYQLRINGHWRDSSTGEFFDSFAHTPGNRGPAWPAVVPPTSTTPSAPHTTRSQTARGQR